MKEVERLATLNGVDEEEAASLINQLYNPEMEKGQRINCTVTSCKYNNGNKNECKLDSIVVAPVKNVNTKKSDESMCSSYMCE